MTADDVGAVTSKVSSLNQSDEKDGDGLSSEFPTSIRVLVVDDDILCLQDLEKLLQDCHYNVTPCSCPKTALSMLREEKNKFDIVLSSVHMQEMDGVTLLKHILKEMDLPVIMMSTDDNQHAVMKSVTEGACHYLIKPIGKKDILTIWQHVVRKRMNQLKELEHSGDMDESERHRKSFEDAGNSSSGNDESGKSSKRRKEVEDDAEDKDATSMPKKQRVVWTTELHNQFVAAVNHLGIEKAMPKKILELMNNPLITRENVASHLQKFRLHQRRDSQHESGLGAHSMDHEVSHHAPMSPVNGRHGLQAPFFPLPLHNRALQVGGLGRSHVPTGFVDVSHGNHNNIVGVGQQQQLTSTINHVNLLHGHPTFHVNEGASGYLNYRSRTGLAGHVDNFVHGNHNSSAMLHMAQSQMSGHLLNGQPASGGQQMFPNEIGQVVVRNETVVNVRGATYNPFTQPSSAVELPRTGLPVNDMALDATPNLPGFTSNGISLDDESCEHIDEISLNRMRDWEFYNVSLNYDSSQSNLSMSPSAFGHQAPATSQRNEQIQNDHGHPDSIVLHRNSLYVENANKINAEMRLHSSSADSIFLTEKFSRMKS